MENRLTFLSIALFYRLPSLAGECTRQAGKIGYASIDVTSAHHFLTRALNYFPQHIIELMGPEVKGKTHYYAAAFFLLLAMLFIVNALVAILVLYISSILKAARDKKLAKANENYEQVLTSYLFEEISSEEAIRKLKYINRPRYREAFLSMLFNYQTNLRGDSDAKILEIFERLNLQQDAGKMANSVFFYKRVMGIRTLTNMYPQKASPFIQKHINDPNDYVRSEAQISYVYINQTKPFAFFDQLVRPFTRWTQMNVFFLVRLYDIQVPSLSAWLKSNHRNIRNFSLRMVTHFQQQEHKDEIIALLDHPDELTRFLAIRAVSELRLLEGKQKLIEIFESETIKNQMEILMAFNQIGENEDIEFLGKVVCGNNISLKIEACRTLNQMSREGRDYLERLRAFPELNIDLFISHVSDPRN